MRTATCLSVLVFVAFTSALPANAAEVCTLEKPIKLTPARGKAVAVAKGSELEMLEAVGKAKVMVRVKATGQEGTVPRARFEKVCKAADASSDKAAGAAAGEESAGEQETAGTAAPASGPATGPGTGAARVAGPAAESTTGAAGAGGAAGEVNAEAAPAAEPKAEPAPATEPEIKPTNTQQTDTRANRPAENLSVGWNTPYALLFSMNNIFSVSNVLSGYGDFRVAGQYDLSPTTAVRVGFGIARTTNPAYTVENTTVAGGVSTTTKQLVAPAPGNYTSATDLQLGADYLMAMTTDTLTPYFGGGVAINRIGGERAFKDDVSVPNETTEVDDSGSSLGFGVRGLLGVHWRIHRSFAVFAEYALGIKLFEHSSLTTGTKVTNAGGTVENKTSLSQNKFFQVKTSLAQGAALGLAVFF